MAEFYFPPEWENVPPPELPEVDPDRIEGLQNGFLAATQAALHTNPDAFYRTTGQDAVEGVPALQEQLAQLRDAALAQAKDDSERAALAPRLDASLIYVQGGIDRHVAAQKQVRNRQIIAERQALNQRAAELDHHDDDSLSGFAEAHANTAQALARLTGADEQPAMLAARSGIWRSAIGQRLATGQGARALDLFDVMKNRLVPADQRALEVPLQAARTDLAADQWIEREEPKEGDPLTTRLQADTTLSPAEKATVLAKVEARASAQESARIATVKGLDDRLDATTSAIAAAPATYRPGTLATIADGYDEAGEPDKANTTRRMALQESFLLPFARSSVAAQQGLIESLPEGEDRAAAETIQRQQAEAFAKDAFTAGTALYPDVGPPVSIDDLVGRIVQARTIAAYRSIPVALFTVDEITALRRQLTHGTPQQREAVLTLVNALPEDVKPVFNDSSGNQPRAYGIDIEALMNAVSEPRADGDEEDVTAAGRQGAVQASEPAPDSPEYRTADSQARRLAVLERITTDRMISQWVSQVRPEDELPAELTERLSADEKREIESLASGAADTKTHPTMLRIIINGLKSRNPEERREWAQTPLYQYRAYLSADDFAKVVELQRDLDPESGYSISELAATRKQLRAKSDTSDLDPLYQAIAPDPQAEYGEILPVARDANGRRVAMPSKLRSFFKGVLDLLGAEKTGELTPEAIDAFTTLAGGAGLAFGPRGGAETLTAGGKRTVEQPRAYAKGGHHWVHGEIRRLPDLSAEARKVFNNASSGWYGELHLWSREHAAYNQAVKELWDKNKYNPSKMTKRDAEDFLEQVRRSRDPRIATFRNMINDKRLKYELSSGARPHGGDK